MEGCDCRPFTLPQIDLIGGGTQEYRFNIYHEGTGLPLSMNGNTCNFSVVDYTNRTEAPKISKAMRVIFNREGTLDNTLSVVLYQEDTIGLYGKYIYQIAIKDIDGKMEPPMQGLLYINRNINQSFQ